MCESTRPRRATVFERAESLSCLSRASGARVCCVVSNLGVSGGGRIEARAGAVRPPNGARRRCVRGGRARASGAHADGVRQRLLRRGSGRRGRARVPLLREFLGAISVFNLDDVLRRSRDATRGAAAVSGEIAPVVVIRAHVGAAYAVVTYGDELLCTAGEDGRTLIFKVTDVVAAADAALAAGTPAVDADVRPVASFANPQERKSRGALGPVPETTALATDPSGGFVFAAAGAARATAGTRARDERLPSPCFAATPIFCTA